ncbi:MAG: hypothetical protein HFJ94_07345 [Muribaculaceae bacterium]|nr:hypothetical protein [Muribaculaceae bacterium]
MKNLKYLAIVACGCIASLTACDENSWNDNELNGFEVPEITDVQTVEYTLTDDDYASVAANSANKALAGDAGAAALKAVGTKFCFSEAIPARDYVPAFLASSYFPYFTLDNGSAVKLTYKTSQSLPEEIAKIESAQQYTVSDENYQTVWGSENDYIAAFAPSHTAAAELPAILKGAYPDAVKGDYVLVKYNVAASDPVFNAPDEPAEDEFQTSSVVATLADGEDCTINGIVTALCTQGFVITDASGSIFVYRGSSFGSKDYEGLKIGDQMVLNGTVEARNASVQITTGATFNVDGNQAVTYPAPVAFTADKMTEIIARTDNATAIYGTMTGTMKVTEGKNGAMNYNLIVDPDIKAQGSPYGATDAQKEILADGAKVTITGWLINVAGGRYCNIVMTDIKADGAAAASTAAVSRAVTVASESESAVYTFNGTKWITAENTVALSHADYQAMGQRYDNLSGESPATMLPAFLKQKFPYAAAEDTKFVVYLYYNTTTSIRCDQYICNGSEWTLNNGIVTETAQFVKTQGKWMYDPNVTITLPAGKGIEISSLYYQTCVDWVAANIDKPTGATYVTSYGNNEYYSGTSAYQGNVDLRAASARAQYPAGYEGMSDDEIVAKMKERFVTQTLPAALSILHPEADVVPGVDVIYTVNFAAYNGSTTSTYTVTYKVTAKATFEYIECNW